MKNPILGKEKIKLLLIRPPAHLWPILNESDNFLMPLGLPSLSAYLKRESKWISVNIIDCLPLKIGYKSLQKMIAEQKPDVIGVGDGLPYVYEATRTLKIAKQINPDIITIAGGHFFSHMAEYSLKNHPEIDFIIKYEGEETLKELLNALRDGTDLNNIRSIAFRRDDKIIETAIRPLIDNLDLLPMPDYEAMPIDKYSPFGKLWPKAITIQGSRGCPLNCNFCSWAAQESEHALTGGKTTTIPRLRAKSVDRVIDEIELLYEKHNIRYLFWVDGTWNFNSAWIDKLCDEILKRKYKLGWWAFVRADLLIEQEKKGILEKMVRAGFRHTLIGGERPLEKEMKLIGKNLKGDELFHASHILKNKYPKVFRQATFVTGIRTETAESMENLGKYTRDSELDFAAFHPIMPYPGTPLWQKANEEGWIEERDFSKYDMFNPVMPSEYLSRAEIAHFTQKLYLDFIKKRPLKYIAGLFSIHAIRRKLQWWFLRAITRVILRDLINSLSGKKKFEGFAAVNKLWKPGWYED